MSAPLIRLALLGALVVVPMAGQRTPGGAVDASRRGQDPAGQPAGSAVERDIDPYTRFEAERLEQLGYRATAPLPLGDGHDSDEVEFELGGGPMRWIETEHFRIGSSLLERALPEDSDGRKLVYEECAALRRRCARLPARPSELDAWLQVHLFAGRLEALYAGFEALVGGASPGEQPAGTHNGCREKFVVLLFERESELGRYARTWCDSRQAVPQAHYQSRRDCWVFATAAAAHRGRLRDPVELHGHVLHAVAEAMVDARSRSADGVPLWWRAGLADHLVSQRQPALLAMLAPASGPAWEPERWREKVLARVRRDVVPDLRDLVQWTDLGGRSEGERAVVWSFFDFLLAEHGEAGAARWMQFLREHPMRSRLMPRQLVLDWHEQALAGAYGAGIDALAQGWRQYVLRNYR